MATGTVKWFNGSQGYGFIEEENGYRAVFVHHSHVTPCHFCVLKEGDRVAFDIEQGHRGPMAVNVERA